ncbi:diol dehydratase small subunit [Wukongibacter baidiensis]|uniref:diol dehydratase small subunit n=1 Tax=Wukongibacter baidiensis TaxID=1723361 RepID=UPI003D7FFBD7
MNQNEMIEKIIREVMISMGNSEVKSEKLVQCNSTMDAKKDYPLAEKRPELVKTPTNRKLEDITLEAVLSGSITANDVRIAPETLELQAQISESVGKDAFARNLRRAAELIAVPDDRILEIYNALRPYRSTKQELLDIAEELESKYDARINGAFVREAAQVYDERNRLKRD